MTSHPISRFPVPRIEDLPADIAERILAVQEKSGFVPNVFLVLAHRPDEFRAFFAYHDALMDKPGNLTKAEREMIVVATSNANQCQYCVVAHGAILRIRAKDPLIADQVAINYRKGPFAPQVKAATNDRGADIILDSIGGAYLAENLDALAPGGRLVLIGLMKGASAEINLATVLRRHLKIFGSTLRSRSVAEKAQIVRDFLGRFGAVLEAGKLRPPVYKTFPVSQVRDAHRMMQASEHFGKIVLRLP